MQVFNVFGVKNTKNKNAHKKYKNAMNIHWVKFFKKIKSQTYCKSLLIGV